MNKVQSKQKKSFKKFILLIGLGVLVIGFLIVAYLRMGLFRDNNISKYYTVVDVIGNNQDDESFENAMKLCGGMTNDPKKDSCFEFIAERMARAGKKEKAKRACDEVKGFQDALQHSVHSKEECYQTILNY